MSGSNDIQVAFSSKSLKVHGKLTQQDSVRADMRADTRGRYAICSDTNDSCVRTRKSAREKRSLVIAGAFRRTVPLARIPRSGDRETQCAFVDPPIVGIYHVDRTCFLLTRTHTPLIHVSKVWMCVCMREQASISSPPLFNPLLVACFLHDESDIYSLSIEC